MGNLRQGPPAAIVLHLMRRYQLRVFVETGTFIGSTAAWASQHFEQVYTIEFAEPIYRQALAAHGQIKNIAFLYGHTREKLAEVVGQLAAPAIFWLDAHWSAGATYGAQDECPVLDEIAIIQSSPHQHFILIDDARMFLAPPPAPHQAGQWPDIDTLLARLSAGRTHYAVVLEDVLIAAPKAAQLELREFYQSYATAQLRQAHPAAPPSLLARSKQAYRRALLTLRQRSQQR